MIVYESHNFFAMMHWRGSVFPKAIRWAIPSAVLSFCLGLLRQLQWSTLDLSSDLEQPSLFNGITFVLGFMLIFRAQQAYSRYWVAATSSHDMRTRFYEACSNIVALGHGYSSTKTQLLEEFNHTTVRLFCLLHALALEELANMMDENFPLIDIESLSKKQLCFLASSDAAGRKVEVVYQWIKVHILNGVKSGVLTSVPPPILTRVFQELGSGLVCYHEAHQVVIWPFPYCYAQMSWLLLSVYIVITPLFVSVSATHAASCFLWTLLSCVAMLGAHFVATELEHPFGDDRNDLPCFEMQQHMIKDLLLLLHPCCYDVPVLLPEFSKFCEKTDKPSHDNSLAYLESIDPEASPNVPKPQPKLYSNKLQKQHNWASQTYPALHAVKIRQALKLSQEDHQPPSVVFQRSKSRKANSDDSADAGTALGSSVKSSEYSTATPDNTMDTGLLNQIEKLITELSSHIKEHLHEQRRQNEQLSRTCQDMIKVKIGAPNMTISAPAKATAPQKMGHANAWPCSASLSTSGPRFIPSLDSSQYA